MIVQQLILLNWDHRSLIKHNDALLSLILYFTYIRFSDILTIISTFFSFKYYLLEQYFNIYLVKVFSWTDFVPLWRQVTSSGVGVKSQKLLVRIVIAINHSSILKYSIAYTAVWFFLWFNLVFLASTQGQPRELELNKQWMELDTAWNKACSEKFQDLLLYFWNH